MPNQPQPFHPMPADEFEAAAIRKANDLREAADTAGAIAYLARSLQTLLDPTLAGCEDCGPDCALIEPVSPFSPDQVAMITGALEDQIAADHS